MITDDHAKVFAQSQWIWPESHSWDIHNGYALFRKEFTLSKVRARAPLFITADQSYQLYLNGKYVCRGPARGFQRSWPYDEVDLHPFIKRGRNVLAIRAYNPGCSNFQYLSQGYAGLLVAAKWDGLSIVSDTTWKCRRQSGVNRDTVPTSLQLFCQEQIDLRPEDPTWMNLDFDDRDWKTLVAVHPWNGMPWSGLESRGIPMLDEKIVLPMVCMGMSSGKCAKNYWQTRDITRVRFVEGLAHVPGKHDAETIQVEPSATGRFQSFLIDFGKTVVGSVGFDIENAAGGEILDTLHAETIDETTLSVHFEPDKTCRMAFGHRLICRPGKQCHTFYHAFGFRYMILTVRDCTAGLQLRPFLRTTLFPIERKGTFHSSEASLNLIWETCAWTQQVCSLDAFVDTPWREQAQWWGDARVQAKNTFFLSGDDRLFRRGIRQIASQTTPEGVTYGHAPTMAHSCILPDFTLIWMITLWDFYWQTGSLEPFKENQETVRRALRYFEERIHPKQGLVGYDDRYWLFLDWTGLFKEGYSSVYNLWLVIALDKMADLFRLTKARETSEALFIIAQKLRGSLEKLVLKNGLMSDGRTFEGQLVESCSIHSQTLAIMAGVNVTHHQQQIEKVLLPYIRGEEHPVVAPSSYWVTYIFELLTTEGHGLEVVKFIQQKWQLMADYGTTWENFAPRCGDESFSHAWSAHPLYHLMQTLGGIRQNKTGWKEIVFHPVFYGKDSRTTVPTPLGNIQSRWKRGKNHITVKLELPEGMSARVLLPGQRPEKIQGRKTWNIPVAKI